MNEPNEYEVDESITGKAIGGKARAASLTAQERRSIAKAAAEKRWSTPALRVTHGDEDHPLRLGGLEIPCYVLEDETRVLSQRGMISSLGMGSGDDRLVTFASGKGVSPFISNELAMTIRNPIRFKQPRGGKPAYGYPATILADICEAVLAARKAGALMHQQTHIAEQCEVLVRGFARVGIIALVDEATGFQKDRARDALSKILEAFVAKELQPWVKTFPGEFYEQMFRLRGLPYPNQSVRRPQYFGHLTNDVIYRRLAPKVWEEIKSQNEKDKADGKPSGHLHRRLTPDIGHPKLRDLLTSVTTVMKLSEKWDDFKVKLEKVHPPFNDTLPLPLEIRKDDGMGI